MLLRSGRTSLRPKKSSDQGIWICGRCFHAQHRLYSSQPSEPENDSPKSSPDEPLSPIDAFRKRFVQQESSTGPPSQSSSPADIFRTNWMNAPPTERPAPQISENF